MISEIFSGIVDGVISAGIAWLERLQQRRADKQAGKLEQKAADDEATIKEAQNASVIKDRVQGASDSELDAYLRSLRDDSPSARH